MFSYSNVLNPPKLKYSLSEPDNKQLGRQIRDNLLWQYPILPGAMFTYMQMAAGREWRVSGPATGVSKAVEFLNNAVCINYDGSIDYGFEAVIKQHALDYNAVGKYSWTAVNGFFEYLDPLKLTWLRGERKWQYTEYQDTVTYSADAVQNEKAIPLGATGNYIAPLFFVLPSATLAWLIREHDNASADGRKIRDIFVCGNKELYESLKAAIVNSIELWGGADPAKNGVPIAWIEKAGGESVDVSKMIARIGLANIPENFNRDSFQFTYVNEIAAALGMSLRHFWNSEKATNRALEEVQEARQQQKGPTAFVRSYQRRVNGSRVLLQFGKRMRLGFDEEVDAQSQETRAKVLEQRANAMKTFMESFAAAGAQIDAQQFLAWQQQEGFLPLEMTLSFNKSDQGTMVESDQDNLPTDGEEIQTSDPAPAPDSLQEKSLPSELDYDEITMDLNGRVLEKRSKIFTVEKAIYHELTEDPITYSTVTEELLTPDFEKFIQEKFDKDAVYFQTHKDEILELHPEAKDLDFEDPLVIGMLVSLHEHS